MAPIINNIDEQNPPKKNGKKVFIYVGVGLGIVALGVGAYYLFFRDKGTDLNTKDLFSADTNPKTTVPTYTPPKNTGSGSYTPPKSPSTKFPLKKGSKGALVKQLQEALIKTYGKSILPKYGADSDFGSETKNALLSKSFPEVVDEITFNKIVSPSANTPTVNTDPTKTVSNKATLTNDAALKIASDLITATKAENIAGVIQGLMKIKNVEDYTLVNEPFKTFALDGKPQSIVNATLYAFDDDTVKMALKSRFLQIGLKYNAADEKWSLSGFPSARIITTCETVISNAKGFCLSVPPSTIIGHEKCRAAGTTTFNTLDGQELFVPTKHVRYV